MDDAAIFGHETSGDSTAHQEFEKRLTKVDIETQLKALQHATGFGEYRYSIGFRKGEGKAPACHIVVVHSEKTPKDIDPTKIPDLKGWQKGSVANKWFFNLLAATSTDEIEVCFLAADSIKLDAIVGSCVTAFTIQNDQGEYGSLTQGLVFRGKREDAATAWSVTVGHPFVIDPPDAADTKPSIFGMSQSNSVEFCQNTDQHDHCVPCRNSDCIKGCETTKKDIVASEGEILVLREKKDLPKSLQGKWIDLALYETVKELITPLDIRPADLLTALEGAPESEELTHAKEIIPQVTKVSENVLSYQAAESLLDEHDVLVMFKKGFRTGWTVGYMYGVDDDGLVRIRNFAGVNDLPGDDGDCGAIWFVIDPEQNAAVPVGYHYGHTTADVQVVSGPEDNKQTHIVKVQVGLANAYFHVNYLLKKSPLKGKLTIKTEDSAKWVVEEVA